MPIIFATFLRTPKCEENRIRVNFVLQRAKKIWQNLEVKKESRMSMRRHYKGAHKIIFLCTLFAFSFSSCFKKVVK